MNLEHRDRNQVRDFKTVRKHIAGVYDNDVLIVNKSTLEARFTAVLDKE